LSQIALNEITEDIVQELFRPGMRLITGNLELNLGGLAIRKPIEELTLTGLVTFSS
jgi:DNA-binding GntR family transcriptional regulator